MLLYYYRCLYRLFWRCCIVAKEILTGSSELAVHVGWRSCMCAAFSHHFIHFVHLILEICSLTLINPWKLFVCFICQSVLCVSWGPSVSHGVGIWGHGIGWVDHIERSLLYIQGGPPMANIVPHDTVVATLAADLAIHEAHQAESIQIVI